MSLSCNLIKLKSIDEFLLDSHESRGVPFKFICWTQQLRRPCWFRLAITMYLSWAVDASHWPHTMPTTTELTWLARLTKFACNLFNGRLEPTDDDEVVVKYEQHTLSKDEFDFWVTLKKYEWCSHSRVELNSLSEAKSTTFRSETSSSEEITISSSSSESFKVMRSLSELLTRLIEEI